MLRPLLTSLITLLLCFGVLETAQAAQAPVEPYAGYEPQTRCAPVAKPGSLRLARWLLQTQGGRGVSIGRACKGRSVSEHKEGRAIDWGLDARKRTDRASAARLMTRLFGTGPSGEPAELARRMGIMYLIWNDRIDAAYDRFRARPYLNGGCRKLTKCSTTLRHRDHVHLPLTLAGSLGRTNWYLPPG